MPKKSRQAHIPSQVRKRKARKPAPLRAVEPAVDPISGEPLFADSVPSLDLNLRALGDASGPVETRPHRRLALLQSRQAEAAPQQGQAQTTLRSVPGLPSFDRSYLTSELRQIALTAGSLLALIIVLAVVLR